MKCKNCNKETSHNERLCNKCQENIRICCKCWDSMSEGYVYNDTNACKTYCSDKCLHKDFTEEEWEDLYEEWWDSYYTEWESIYLD